MLVIGPLQVSTSERACLVCMQEDARGEGAKLDSGVGDDRAQRQSDLEFKNEVLEQIEAKKKKSPF